ncbi:hypothetical protein GCM10010245_87760 [Streptomyces spectabilis]|nr:hypothetical protein GCM10010245_87760 [Streptomyces spectabilis]
MPGESDRFGMQGHRLARGDVAPHDGLGAVIDDCHGHPAEVRERPPGQSKKVSRSRLVVKQQNGSREYERAMWNEQTFPMPVCMRIPPVDLRLGARDHLEPAVQAHRRRGSAPRPKTTVSTSTPIPQ